MSLDRGRIASLLAAARHRGRGVMLETEGLALLDALGIETPRRIEFGSPHALPPWHPAPIPGERVVLKALGPRLLHKTEAHAVMVLPNRRDVIAEESAAMARRLGPAPLDGFVLQEMIPHEHSLGHELLLGLRWTDAFGPVVTLGAGGIHTEFLASVFAEGEALAVLSPALAGSPAQGVGGVLRGVPLPAAARLVTETRRGRLPELGLPTLERAVAAFLELGEAFCPDPIAEFEVNPLVLSGGRLVAVDALLRFGAPAVAAPPRPVEKIARLLAPRSIAILGVSERMNPGRVILQNTLRAGFDAAALTVIKPGRETLDGCRCVPSVEALPARVDLLVVALPAAAVPAAFAAIVAGERAESVILIPGGLEEHEDGAALAAGMRKTLEQSRSTPGRGPVVNGGNCLGIRSAPGRINTLFIPDAKLPAPSGADPLALICGSGAFAASKSSKLERLNPRYTITFGNQMDLTLSDYLEHLERDPEVAVFALYAEGFRTLDGRRFLLAARRITDSGRTVILYPAGRTRAGAAAAASHTAAVAADHEVTRQLAGQAGVLVAATLEEFEDLVRLAVRLHGRAVRGMRLGALSNAGFECVTIADRLGGFELARFSDATLAGLRAVAERAGLGAVVSVRNPLDLSPVTGDQGTAEAARLLLEDPGVDVALVGCVPLTGALETLAAGEGHEEDFLRPGSLARRLARLHAETLKPWVVVVDGGALYDPMAEWLERAGVPTFRTADRALGSLARFCAHRLGSRTPSKPAGSPGASERVPAFLIGGSE